MLDNFQNVFTTIFGQVPQGLESEFYVISGFLIVLSFMTFIDICVDLFFSGVNTFKESL